MAPDEMFDSLTILACWLPILLLRVPPLVQRDAKAGFIVRNCHRFLPGAWRSLTLAAQDDLQAANNQAISKSQVLAAEQPTDSAVTASHAWNRSPPKSDFYNSANP